MGLGINRKMHIKDWTLFLLLFLGLGILGWYISKNTPDVSKAVPTKVVVRGTRFNGGNAKVNVKQGENLIFPSGARITLMGTSMRFVSDEGVANDKGWSFTQMKVYANGYMHDLKQIKCNKEIKFFDDYWAEVTTSCDAEVSVKKSAAPAVPTYSKQKYTFYSRINDQKEPHIGFRQLSYDTLLKAYVPYFQLFFRTDGGVVNVVSPQNETVVIYTSYGSVGISWKAEEIKAKQDKTVSIGPLVVHMRPAVIDCFVPYRGMDGKCHGDKVGTTYNAITFEVWVENAGNRDDAPTILTWDFI